LFPNICHVHYRKLSKIVKETAREYDLPYHVHSNFILAIYNHALMLWRLGKYDSAYSS
jgi:linoleoyl-CoA desaturase